MANMRRVGPELQRLKERFGDDRQNVYSNDGAV